MSSFFVRYAENSRLWVIVAVACVLTTLTALSAHQSLAATISAEAFGSATPPILPYPNILVNGDFTVSPGSGPVCPGAPSCPVGNGVDEVTEWTFDFSGSAALPLVKQSPNLDSAFLTLILNASPALDASGVVHTDAVRILGLPLIEEPIQTLSPITIATVEIELLDFYSSSDILGFLQIDNSIPMRYIDDAIVSYARLDIQVAPQAVPVPPTMALLAGSLILFFMARRSSLRHPLLRG